jgi:hypothetical protein
VHGRSARVEEVTVDGVDVQEVWRPGPRPESSQPKVIEGEVVEGEVAPGRP